MKGDNLLIITNGGGVGVLATDAAERYGIPLKFAPDDVQAELKKHMPEFGSAKNPVDLTGMAGNEWYYDSVKYAYAHKWTDGLVVLYCETAMTNPMEIAKSIKKAVVDANISRTNPSLFPSSAANDLKQPWHGWSKTAFLPTAPPIVAVNAMAALREYARLHTQKASFDFTPNPAARKVALQIIAKARADGRDALTEIEAKQVFTAYGLPVTDTQLAKTEDEAVALAKKIGFPIVMKIVSPDILHKSDAGGVKVNIKDEDRLFAMPTRPFWPTAKAYKADANIHGIAIQEMAPWALK